MGRRRGGRRGRRSRNRARARSRAQSSARKRNAARKASGRRPSGANRARSRAQARARAQAAARKRVAAKRAAASRAASKKKAARTAAAKRAAAKAAAKKRAQEAAKKRIAAKKASEAKAAAAKKAATTKKATTQTKQRKATAKTTRESAFNKQLKTIQRNQSFGPVADGAKYARNITNYNMKYGKTPAIRAKAYEQSLNKKSFKGLSDGQTFGVGPVASGDAYARGLNTDNQNVENRLRQVRNLGSTLTGGLIPSVRKLTDKEISDRRMKVAAQRQANFMGRPTGGKGNKSSIIDPPPLPSELIEETQPTTDIGREQTGTDSSNLTRIQNQAYATTLANNMAGLTGDFDFGQQSSQMSISEAPGLQAGQSRGRRRIRRFNRGRRRGAGDSFRRGGRRIQEFTSTQLNI